MFLILTLLLESAFFLESSFFRISRFILSSFVLDSLNLNEEGTEKDSCEGRRGRW